MLQVVRESRSEMRPLVDATGLHPNLDGSDRSSGIWFEHDGEAVREDASNRRIAP